MLCLNFAVLIAGVIVDFKAGIRDGFSRMGAFQVQGGLSTLTPLAFSRWMFSIVLTEV